MDVSPDVFDLTALKRNFAGDLEFVGALLEKFEARYPAQLAAIHGALSRGESEAAGNAAHQLAGEASVFYSNAARRAALTVEDLARAARLAEAEKACQSLRDKIIELVAAIRGLVQG